MSKATANYGQVLYDLNISSEIIDNSVALFKEEKLLNILKSPVIQLDLKYNVIDKLFNKEIATFLKVVCKNGRMAKIMDIFQDYRNYSDKQKGILRAEVMYFTKPTKEDQLDIEKFLKNKFSAKEVVLTLIEKPQLMGGFVILANGHEFDRSYKEKLTVLKNMLVRR